MNQKSPSQPVPDLLSDVQPDLAEIVRHLAAPQERHDHYTAMTARRNVAESVVNAFEVRRETCPSDVRAPLNGLPITVKDQVAVAGWPRSFGLERRATKADETSSTLVSRLQALGAVVTAKTALPPYAMDFQTANRRRGPTRNPRNPDFTAGGSTGGGAAAVASGMSLLDVGADLGGSLRVPAGWCGVTSYTPTEGLWPNDGLLRGTQKLAHFARIGLTARSAMDLDYIWRILQPEHEAPRAHAKAPRIALWLPDEGAPCDEDTLAAWKRLGTTLKTTSAVTNAITMDLLFESEVYRLAGEIIGHETGALVPWLIRQMMRRDQRAKATSPGFIAHVHTGYRRDMRRYEDNLQQLSERRAAATATWKDVDALILPVTGVCAFEHVDPVRDQNGVRTYDKVFDTRAGRLGYFDAMTRFTLPLTMLGWPVVTLPFGHDSNGLPIGAQLVGKPGEDDRLLALAKDVQAWLD